MNDNLNNIIFIKKGINFKKRRRFEHFCLVADEMLLGILLYENKFNFLIKKAGLSKGRGWSEQKCHPNGRYRTEDVSKSMFPRTNIIWLYVSTDMMNLIRDIFS